jgi:hypothetical protein
MNSQRGKILWRCARLHYTAPGKPVGADAAARFWNQRLRHFPPGPENSEKIPAKLSRADPTLPRALCAVRTYAPLIFPQSGNLIEIHTEPSRAHTPGRSADRARLFTGSWAPERGFSRGVILFAATSVFLNGVGGRAARRPAGKCSRASSYQRKLSTDAKF